MSWTITYTKGGNDNTLYGYSRANIDMELSGAGTFEIKIPNPSTQLLSDLAVNTEVKITAWQNSLYGYIKEAKYDGQKKILLINGVDYSVLLQNVYIHCDNTSDEDTTLSSGYSVVYTSKDFDVVAEDALSNTGIDRGTIANYGNTSYRFQHKTVLDVIKYLASYANYDWQITTAKELNMGERIGSATSVYSFNTNTNCSIANISDDGQTGRVYKIKVLGAGDGSSQVYGEWAAGDFSSDPAVGKNKMRVFVDSSITSNAIATQVASNLGGMLNGNFTSASFSTVMLSANVQLGDAITLTDNIKGTNTLRVMRIHRSVLAGNDYVSYEAVDNSGRLKKMSLEDFLNKNRNLTEVLGSTAQGSIKTFEIPFENKGDSTNKVMAQWSMPSECTSTGNILKAILYVERGALKYDTGTDTGDGTQNTSDTGHSGHAIGSYADSGHTHNVAATTSGASVGLEDLGTGNHNHGGANGASAPSTFTSICSTLSNANVETTDFIFLAVTIYNADTSDHICYVRINEDGSSGYFPDSAGAYVNIVAGKSATVPLIIPNGFWSESSSSHDIEWKSADSGWTYYISYDYWETTSHTHTINAKTSASSTANIAGSSGSGTANINNPSHTNPITQGINVPAETAKTINVDLGVTNVYSASLNVDENSGNQDITTEFRTAGLTGIICAYPTTSQAYLKGKITVTFIDTNP